MCFSKVHLMDVNVFGVQTCPHYVFNVTDWTHVGLYRLFSETLLSVVYIVWCIYTVIKSLIVASQTTQTTVFSDFWVITFSIVYYLLERRLIDMWTHCVNKLQQHVVLRMTLIQPTTVIHCPCLGDAGVMVQYYCADLALCKSFIYNRAILWGAINNYISIKSNEANLKVS